jgi:hypothetical protein
VDADGSEENAARAARRTSALTAHVHREGHSETLCVHSRGHSRVISCAPERTVGFPIVVIGRSDRVTDTLTEAADEADRKMRFRSLRWGGGARRRTVRAR